MTASNRFLRRRSLRLRRNWAYATVENVMADVEKLRDALLSSGSGGAMTLHVDADVARKLHLIDGRRLLVGDLITGSGVYVSIPRKRRK